ncbi:hypothetical protein [Mesorhizobium sp. WSM2239]|uniref:Uncharacterized protein n=2 Tax=unclassified Mesorhizobium TaxID=325217 RepID=A0AAU8DI47_9HYPH
MILSDGRVTGQASLAKLESFSMDELYAHDDPRPMAMQEHLPAGD